MVEIKGLDDLPEEESTEYDLTYGESTYRITAKTDRSDVVFPEEKYRELYGNSMAAIFLADKGYRTHIVIALDPSDWTGAELFAFPICVYEAMERCANRPNKIMIEIEE